MRIGFIGAGQMARALAKGFVASHRVAAGDIIASDCSKDSLDGFESTVPGIRRSNRNADAAATDVLFLAVKPQHLTSVYESIAPVDESTLVVSIAAGVRLTALTSGLQTQRVVRVMPNTPCLVGKGAAGYCCGAAVSDADRAHVAQLLDAVAVCFEVSEPLIDVVTGLSGSGPAFVYLFIEALSDGAVQMGLPRPIAQQLAAQTVAGAAQMVLETGKHTGVLKDQVTSPGGTTIAGIRALEDRAFRGTVMSAVESATRRSRELGT